MSIYKRGNVWWLYFPSLQTGGTAIRQSAGTTSQREAQELHDTLKAQLWRVGTLKERQKRTWEEAALRWLEEKSHKKSIEGDVNKIRWLTPHLKGRDLETISADLIRTILKKKPNLRQSTVNRYLALVRSMLRTASKEWEWIEKAPFFKLAPEPQRRVRWLKPEEIAALIEARLPKHRAPTLYAFATGVRLENVAGLKWTVVDLDRRLVTYAGEDMKNAFPLGVPLNDTAVKLIEAEKGKHPVYVFSHKGGPVNGLNGAAFKRACKAAGLENFRFHDIRHTWASLLKQRGASDS